MMNTTIDGVRNRNVPSQVGNSGINLTTPITPPVTTNVSSASKSTGVTANIPNASQSTGRVVNSKGRSKGFGRGGVGRGRGNNIAASPAVYTPNNESTRQPHHPKRPRLNGLGCYINEQTGLARAAVIVPPAHFKHAFQPIDLGFKPPELKWKGKNVVITKQLQQEQAQMTMQNRRSAQQSADNVRHSSTAP
ncbi:conserved hypothetical protein [Ricinus communis]|uniref:Uncharacterized protein n=1 Tax=Ricinus communis TaxID=3988 RepID=B9RMJ3_RICCO|nr:conserved hypothetical protein [Ricinus communis]